ncbi:uncharacterized protein LOC122252784 isoform X2 [Penaeus japonicus]|uniref:uncharacterized protein LOC122252784 isoform X2 n=1 Tax=Penaeus japonicus TaxID=27405 RepID=UPI001C7163E1|nr:uncharacterized protein LOC122252784 isoform X2 [Penaeus japonicus]
MNRVCRGIALRKDDHRIFSDGSLEGINTALDLVEEALISLQEKAKQQPLPARSDAESHCIRDRPQPSTSDAHLETSKKVKTTGVLIKRQPRSRSRNLKSGSLHPGSKRRVKAKKKQDASVPRANNPNENLSSSSDDTPRRLRSQRPRSTQEPFRPRSKRGNESDAQRLPCDSTHRSIIDSPSHDHGPSHRSSKRQVNRGSSRMAVETSEDEVLPGRRYKSTRRSNSRGSHSKHHPRERGSFEEEEESDSVTSHREMRRTNPREIITLSSRGNSTLQSTKTKNLTARSAPAGTAVNKPSHRYAQPTLTSRLRTELLERREAEEKENLIPFIPSGSKNKSFHLGVIIQKELGRLKNIPPKELENAMTAQQAKHGNKGSTSRVTEEAVKLAMQNIEKEITAVTKQISKQ